MESNDQAWTEYRKQFSQDYDNQNYSGGMQAFVMRRSHELIEAGYDENAYFSKVLEVGAGTGEHFPFVRHKFDQYIVSDNDPNALNVSKEKNKNRSGDLVFELQDAANLTYPDNTFDRVISCHVLEHLYMPHLVLREWVRVLKGGGVLSVLIPTDPGMAWRLGRCLGPRKNAVSRGIAYDYIMARDHVNSCYNLVHIMRHFFLGSKESWWPFFVSSVDMNLFVSFDIKVVKHGVA